jgi:hypothetical protein
MKTAMSILIVLGVLFLLSVISLTDGSKLD